MQQNFAETQALHVLGWLVAEEEILPVFMGSTGTNEGDLRTRASDPEFLASVLDFVLMDDAWVVSAAEALGQAPEDIVKIRAGLPGGDLPNWT